MEGVDSKGSAGSLGAAASAGSASSPAPDPRAHSSVSGGRPEFFQGGLGGTTQFSSNLERDVVLRVEFMSERQTRILILGQVVVVLAGAGILGWLLWARRHHAPSWWFQDNSMTVLNIVLGSICLLALLTCAGFYAERTWRTLRQGRHWGRRRAVMAGTALLELCAGAANTSVWLVASCWLEANRCAPQDWGIAISWTQFLMYSTLNAIYILLLVQATNLLPVSSLRRLAPWVLVWPPAAAKQALGPSAGDWQAAAAGEADKEETAEEGAKGAGSGGGAEAGSSNGVGGGAGAQRAQQGSAPWQGVLMDLTWWHQAPKLLLFSAVEVPILVDLLIGLGVIGNPYSIECEGDWDVCGKISIKGMDGPCSTWVFQCNLDPLVVVFSTLKIAAFITVLTLYYIYLYLAVRQYRKLPYAEHRTVNVLLRFMVNTRLGPALFSNLAIILIWFAQMGSCAGYAEASFGAAPVQIVSASLVLVNALLFMPKVPRLEEVELVAWLQQYAWLEVELPRRLARRPGRRGEPMFCFETALKLCYWADLAYELEEPGEMTEGLSLETALGLLGLTDHKVLWETNSKKNTDSKCIVAWGREARAVLVVYRGTASLENVLADLKVWRVAHPPPRGSYMLGTRPLIHTGFWKTYKATREGMLGLLCSIMAEDGSGSNGSEVGGSGGPEGGAAGDRGDVNGRGGGAAKGRPWRLYFTGHSLGGAMANLAAFDAARSVAHGTLPRGCELRCYTFGAPRTGNHAWAREYRLAVPETWMIINDDDAVCKGGKFVALFKHCGHRVIITPHGDLIVRPSFLESTVRGRFVASVAQHMLTSYKASLKACMKAQFASKKGSPAGRKALLALMQSQYVQEMLVRGYQLRGETQVLLLLPSAESEGALRLAGASTNGGGGGADPPGQAMANGGCSGVLAAAEEGLSSEGEEEGPPAPPPPPAAKAAAAAELAPLPMEEQLRLWSRRGMDTNLATGEPLLQVDP